MHFSVHDEDLLVRTRQTNTPELLYLPTHSKQVLAYPLLEIPRGRAPEGGLRTHTVQNREVENVPRLG